MAVLGLDTSNYTTSAALFRTDTGMMLQQKRLLPVAQGEMGLRQSDALFHHVRQLPDIVTQLRSDCADVIDCVGASDRPQQTEGSYMPCFLAGAGAAKEIAACLSVPAYFFTHQQGHVAAALYSADKLHWMNERFLAFHVSGGTTDALLVEPDDACLIRCRVVARSLDLKAGQLIDRVGGMLGLDFPAGPALERLAASSDTTFCVRASMEDGCCHLSGVQNQCERRLRDGASKEDVAKFCLVSVEAALCAMTQSLLKQYGDLPIVYAGGVMSNAYLQQSLGAQFGGAFAQPMFSADNAAGIAVLAAMTHQMKG